MEATLLDNVISASTFCDDDTTGQTIQREFNPGRFLAGVALGVGSFFLTKKVLIPKFFSKKDQQKGE